MSHINKYLRNFKPYKVASHKVWTVSSDEKKRILKLDWNESTLGPSPLVRERLKVLIEKGDFFNLYPSTYNEKLYQLLSKYVGLPVENIQYFASSDSLHEYIAKLFISVGDPVVILWPSYDNFRLTAEVNGGRIYFFDFNNDFSFDQKSFKKYLQNVEPSLVYICNPNNPTGYYHNVSFIESLLQEFPDAMFLIDEAYYEFADTKESCASLCVKYENVLVSRTMSKAFGIANFRFGYLLSSRSNISYISSIRNPKNITTFAQEAAMAVLEDIPYMKEYVRQVNEAKKMFLAKLQNMKRFKVYNSAGNFVMIQFNTYEEKIEMFDYLCKQNIFVRTIDQSPIVHNCLRISIGNKQQMNRVINAIGMFYEKQ